MNLFILDNDISECWKAQTDTHVRKMPIEAVQILSTVVRGLNGTPGWIFHEGRDLGLFIQDSLPGERKGPHRMAALSTHPNHPCTRWVGACLENWNWALKFAKAGFAEFTFRFGKRHATEDLLDRLTETIFLWGLILPDERGARTPFVRGFTGYEAEDTIEAYRLYYDAEKAGSGTWTNRAPPRWLGCSTAVGV